MENSIKRSFFEDPSIPEEDNDIYSQQEIEESEYLHSEDKRTELSDFYATRGVVN